MAKRMKSRAQLLAAGSNANAVLKKLSCVSTEPGDRKRWANLVIKIQTIADSDRRKLKPLVRTKTRNKLCIQSRTVQTEKRMSLML